jgi:uncharacterized membrane protein YsdA (DUF1294 family)
MWGKDFWRARGIELERTNSEGGAVAFLGISALMSLAAFVAMGSDKLRAKRGRWRVPERTLWLLAALFGAPGAYLGMLVFRHKVRNAKFALLLPMLSAAQLIFVGWNVFSR